MHDHQAKNFYLYKGLATWANTKLAKAVQILLLDL